MKHTTLVNGGAHRHLVGVPQSNHAGNASYNCSFSTYVASPSCRTTGAEQAPCLIACAPTTLRSDRPVQKSAFQIEKLRMQNITVFRHDCSVLQDGPVVHEAPIYRRQQSHQEPRTQANTCVKHCRQGLQARAPNPYLPASSSRMVAVPPPHLASPRSACFLRVGASGRRVCAH